MNRLGLNDLALGFIARAIHLAEQSGESEWSGPGAQPALAEVAIDAGEYDLVLTALATRGQMISKTATPVRSRIYSKRSATNGTIPDPRLRSLRCLSSSRRSCRYLTLHHPLPQTQKCRPGRRRFWLYG